VDGEKSDIATATTGRLPPGLPPSPVNISLGCGREGGREKQRRPFRFVSWMVAYCAYISCCTLSLNKTLHKKTPQTDTVE